MSRLRLAFMGTPDFALVALKALHAAGHEIACVYSQPPRPAGRGQKPRPSPVQAFAEQTGLTVRTPTGLKSAEQQAEFAALDLDVAVVAAYGLILPGPILAAPARGCLNIHASLLPRWRGAAPIQRALLAGDAETGVTIMQMDAGLDTGAMLLADRLAIGPATNAGQLHDALALMGARLILAALDDLAAGRLTPTPQPADGVTYAHKIDKADSRIDWQRPAIEIDRQIRAFSPWPGAWLRCGEDRIKVLTAQPVAATGPVGTVLADGLTVACGSGALRLTRLQRAGRAPIDAEDFRRGYPALAPGVVLG